MFKRWSIRRLLHLWAGIAALILLLMSILVIVEQNHHSKNQLRFSQTVLPLIDAAQQFSDTANNLIFRQNQIVHARSKAELANVASRQASESTFKQLILSIEQLVNAPELASRLSDYYQRFLLAENQLLQQAHFQVELSEASAQRKQNLTLLGEDIQNLTEIIRDKVELTRRQSLVEQTSYLLLSHLLRLRQLSESNQQNQSTTLLESLREVELLLHRDISVLKQQLNNDSELITLLDRLQQEVEQFIVQAFGGDSSLFQLQLHEVESSKTVEILQRESSDNLEKLVEEVNSLSASTVEQELTKTEQSVIFASTIERWLISCYLVLVLLIIGYVFFITRRIHLPLQRLRKAMNALSVQKFETRLQNDNDQLEFNLLANDFNLFAKQTQHLISKLDETKRSVEIRQTWLRAVLNGVPEAIFALQSDGSINSCNPAAEKILQASESQLAGQNILRFFAPSTNIHSLAELDIQHQINQEFEGQNWYGETFTMWLSLKPLSELDDNIWVCVISDISSWKSNKLALMQTSNELNAILENAMVGIAFIKNRQIIRVNTKFETLFLNSRDVIEGQSTRDIHPSEEAFQRFGEQAYKALSVAESFESQVELIRANGETFWCAVSGQVIDPENPTNGSIWLYEDVTQQRQNEERLMRLASNDILTGLPNRGVFKDRLEQAIRKAQRSNGRLAVFFLDLDHFKHINDSLGHKAGDILLCEVARRICSCVRESDTVARLGGDEFTVILEDIHSAEYVGKIAEKILNTASVPYLLDNTEVNVSPSIGISLYPADGRDVDMLVRNADAAMYYAKSSGRNNFQFYSSEMNAQASQRLAMETGLRRAVELQEFYLQYQPQIDLETGRVAGVEVLLRWQTELWGDVSPAIFVPVLEDTGLINVVGEWVLKKTCEAFMANQSFLPEDFLMAVNLSGRQFNGNSLVNFIRDLLEQTGMPAKNLELEITESLLMENTEQTVLTLRELSSLGITLAIDDFGTGYSSLSYLKQFPLNVLKIDRAFVRDVTEDSDDAAIVNAILAMSKSLALQVVAEGVETAEQLAFLANSDCKRAQGFYFSKAIDLDDLIKYIKQNDQALRAL